jgi:hypothetical protein
MTKVPVLGANGQLARNTIPFLGEPRCGSDAVPAARRSLRVISVVKDGWPVNGSAGNERRR